MMRTKFVFPMPYDKTATCACITQPGKAPVLVCGNGRALLYCSPLLAVVAAELMRDEAAEGAYQAKIGRIEYLIGEELKILVD